MLVFPTQGLHLHFNVFVNYTKQMHECVCWEWSTVDVVWFKLLRSNHCVQKFQPNFLEL